MLTESEIVIVGAGLSGLTAAYALTQKGLAVKVLESRNRYGGRIHTIRETNNDPVEMGATWLGAKHQHLIRLLDELEIKTFEQVMGSKAIFEPISTSPPYLASLPPNPEPSLRIQAGTDSVINRLVEAIGADNILLNSKVKEIREADDILSVHTPREVYKARNVILTLPPYLMVKSINFSPSLPQVLTSTAEATHTWMGESIKIALRYDKPFWKTDKLSGTIISNVGPIPEMYDHSNVEGNSSALMGFLNGNYHNVSRETRLELILKQLRKYFGEIVDGFTEYIEEVWMKENDTSIPYDQHILPHQNNGHKIYQDTFCSDKLIIAGTETSQVYPGYMEGAVYSGLSAAQKVIQLS